MSILNTILKQSNTVVGELKGMNTALKTMGARDKTAYTLDHRQRKYEREQDKRRAQDQKKLFKSISSGITEKTEELNTDQAQEKLGAGISVAIGKAISQIKKQHPDQRSDMGGGEGGFGPPLGGPPRPSSGPIQSSVLPMEPMVPSNDDTEIQERLEALEEKVFSFGDQKKYKKFQSGGFTGAIPNLGQPATGDHFYTHVEPGSYVMNRNAVAAMGFQSGGNVPVALERGEVVIPPGQYDNKILDILNYEMFPRFQQGGAPKKLPGNGPPSEDTIAPLGMTKEQYQKKQKGGKIFLHWAGSGYSGASSAYHATVQGDGKVIKTRDYNTFGGGHTYKRNTTGIGISLAAMHDATDRNFGSYPVKPEQYEAMAKLVAKIAKEWGWTPANITVNNVMTHAEAGSNKDGGGAHENYGPQPWGGTGKRWDLWKLYEKDPNGSGGEKIRNMIRSAMGGDPQVEETSAGTVTNPDTGAGTAGDSNSSIPDYDEKSATPTGIAGAMFGALTKWLAGADNNYGLTAGMLMGQLAGGTGRLLSGGKKLFDSIGGNFLGGGGEKKEQEQDDRDDSPVDATPLPASTQEKAKMMYEYIKSKGYTDAQAKGIVANIHRESTFRPHIASGDDQGPGGLFQWMGERQTPTVHKLVKAGDWKGQIDYALKEDVGPKYKNATAGMNAVDAAYWWMDKWERPADKASGHRKHKQYIKSYNFQKGGNVTSMSKKVGNMMSHFMMMNDGELAREAMADSQPSFMEMDGGAGEEEGPSHSMEVGNNYPGAGLPSRDSCPLSIYYRYHPSFNPQGFNP